MFDNISAHSKDYFGQVAFTNWLAKYIGKKRLDYLEVRKVKIEKTTIDFLEKEYEKLLNIEKMMVEMTKSKQKSPDGVLTDLLS